jgi:hypothetical protein
MEAILILAVFALVALMGAVAELYGSDSRDTDTKTIDQLGA